MSNQNEKLSLDTIREAVPGPQLDRLVHRHVFGKSGPPPRYSDDISKILPAIEMLGIAVGKSRPGDAHYVPEKPFWSGHLSQAVFTTSSPASALCKAALFFKTQL